MRENSELNFCDRLQKYLQVGEIMRERGRKAGQTADDDWRIAMSESLGSC